MVINIKTKENLIDHPFVYDWKVLRKQLSSPKLHSSKIQFSYITLPTKVRLVKAMVFPVVMYGCESWTVKKAEPEELMLLNCGAGEDS